MTCVEMYMNGVSVLGTTVMMEHQLTGARGSKTFIKHGYSVAVRGLAALGFVARRTVMTVRLMYVQSTMAFG